MQCKICNREFKDIHSLSCHLSKSKERSLEQYYLSYIGSHGKCSVCGKPTKFKNLSMGYSTYCSISCMNKSPEHIQSIKDSNMKKYGVSNVFQLEEVKEKSKNTLLKKTGHTHNSKNPDTIQKRKDTWVKNYGEDHPWKSDIIQSIKNQTLIDKYGSKYVLQNDEIKEKQQNTCLYKYGVDNVSKTEEVIEKIKQNNKLLFFNKLINSERCKDRCIPNFNIDEYTGVSGKYYSWICKICNNEFKDTLDNGHIPRCYKCFPIPKSSRFENEVYDFCKQYFKIVYSNTRFILKDIEIDVYIPEIKLGIECNGLYWHSESQGKDKNYHITKYLRLKELGISLINIFEDEWLDKKEIVKSILLSKMSKIQNKIYARKCQVSKIDNRFAETFLFDNHIQGSIKGIHYGLYYNNELVSVMTLGRSRYDKKYEYEIYRYCSKINYTVVGGLSKILKYFEEEYKPKSIITYADLRYGEGMSYSKTGFKFKYKSNPGFSYISNKERSRISRLMFQKHLLKDKLEIHDSNLSVWENMQLNGYDRIWDCGNNVYEKY